MLDLPKGVQPLCNLTMHTNGYLLRVINQSDVHNIAGNWQPLKEEHRFDAFIKKYINANNKRCYFCSEGFIENLDRNIWFALNESCRDDEKQELVVENKTLLRLPCNIIDTHLTDNILTSYYFINLDSMKISSPCKGAALIPEILQHVDVENPMYKTLQKRIIGLRVNSRFIGETSYGQEYGSQNIIILDNNPVYELLVNNAQLWETYTLPTFITKRPEK